jgi:putative DNA primase/helicase
VIRQSWARWPYANVGIATGRDSGLVVVDVDPRNGGEDSLLALERKSGELPQTVEALTGGGGRHILFAHPGRHIKNGQLAQGVDIKADGGYIVVPPSIHASGRPYAWETCSHPDDVALAPLPEWIVRLNEDGRHSDSGRSDPARIPDGTRNDTLTSLAGSMRRRGMTESAIRSALLVENADRCTPPLPEDDVQAIARSVARYNSAPEDFHRTDLGNARRFIARHGQNLRYCDLWRTWLGWDGVRWVADNTGAVWRLAKETVTAMYEDAAALQDENARTDLAKHTLKSESEARIRAMIELAKTEPGIPIVPAELDADPWLLNVKNGTVDLRTGKLRPQRRDDRLTKLAPVAYDPDVRADLWESFLARILPDPELRAFVQRAVGYSITGLTTEERLFFAYGPTATGKSTFLGAITAALGEYAMTADFETFLARPNVTGGPRNDIARLAGARLVVSQEVDDGKRLAEGLIKQVTGGDRISARFLHKETFEFEPAFTLWLSANNRPRVRHDDDALWRRILQIPFVVQIPEGERSPTLKARLRAEEVGSAVLAWAIRGCLQWQHSGLGVPPAVRETTEEYRGEMDPLREFLADRCVLAPTASVQLTELWNAYQQWSRDANERWPIDRKRFTKVLAARGVTKGHKGRNRMWLGIGLLVTGSATQHNADLEGFNYESPPRVEYQNQALRNVAESPNTGKGDHDDE